MDLDLHLQVWQELKPHLLGADINESAEAFIKVLIEHGADAEEFTEYSLDDALKLALQEYIEIEEDEVDEDVDEYEEDY